MTQKVTTNRFVRQKDISIVWFINKTKAFLSDRGLSTAAKGKNQMED